MSSSSLKAMYSRWIKPFAIAVALVASQPLVTTAAEEFEIHRGEEFTSPGVGPKEELHFVRVFTVSGQQWNKQPRANPRAKPPLSARKALELAEASLDPSDTAGSDNLHVTKLELRTQPSRDPDNPKTTVAFYVVDFLVNDNEVQRLVLMDGTVLKPQLTRVPSPAEGKR